MKYRRLSDCSNSWDIWHSPAVLGVEAHIILRLKNAVVRFWASKNGFPSEPELAGHLESSSQSKILIGRDARDAGEYNYKMKIAEFRKTTGDFRALKENGFIQKDGKFVNPTTIPEAMNGEKLGAREVFQEYVAKYKLKGGEETSTILRKMNLEIQRSKTDFKLLNASNKNKFITNYETKFKKIAGVGILGVLTGAALLVAGQSLGSSLADGTNTNAYSRWQSANDTIELRMWSLRQEKGI